MYSEKVIVLAILGIHNLNTRSRNRNIYLFEKKIPLPLIAIVQVLATLFIIIILKTSTNRYSRTNVEKYLRGEYYVAGLSIISTTP